MLHVVLVHPEIPPNTGNIIRLCANTGAQLHLVEPLGFPLEDAKLRRAGLDYHEYATMRVHADWAACKGALGERRRFAMTTRGSTSPYAVKFADEDVLCFGSETKGLPEDVRADFTPAHWLRLPMRPNNRSLNLSNAVAVTVYEAWRQLGFSEAI
jgi:tRNA (cytidine/uridine-2'-O-)-methyltransferase